MIAIIFLSSLKRIIKGIFILVTIFLLSGFSSQKPIIVDTDMAVDDWGAILYLVNHPQADIRAITVTGVGEAHCQPGTRNALNLLELAGVEEGDITVACGDEEPSDGYREFPLEWRDAVDSLEGIKIPNNPQKPYPQDAVDLIITILENSDKPVNILALGPLTNLAELLETNEAIANKINRIYIMGGAVRVKGNIIVPGFTDDLKNEVAELNIYVDPIAAQKVFRSNVPITLIPLDATNYVPVTKDFTNKLKQNATTEEAKFISQVFDKIQPMLDSGKYYFWDAVAAATMINKDFCNYENLKLDVIVDYTDDEDSIRDLPSFSQILENGKMRRQLDPYKSGQTIISENGKAIEVCTKVNRERFNDDFIQIINRIAISFGLRNF